MDISAIREAIIELEQSEATVANVQELANLYIVIQELSKHEPAGGNSGETSRDTLPRYIEYCDIKRRYQMNEVAEDAIIKSIKSLCSEIQEFIQTLYSNTDFNKERVEIRVMLESLSNQYCN